MFSRRQLLKGAGGLAVLGSFSSQRALAKALENTGLAKAFSDDFLIGAALGRSALSQQDAMVTAIAGREFNSITAENAMKWGPIHPQEDEWNWETADQFVAFGEKHQQHIQGHCLVWHSQTPNWLFVDEQGKPVTAAVLEARMSHHIQTLMGRYHGKINGWDVVNEAVEDAGGWRQSPWFQIMGPQYMERAFALAHEVDPKCHLIYNDYNMHLSGKREFLLGVLQDYKKRGVPIHGVGLQGHVGLGYPDLAELEKTIVGCARLGLRVHITELEVDVLPAAWKYTGADIATGFEYSDELNPYVAGLPQEVEQQLADRYTEIFRLFLKHRDAIDRVTFWGVSDADSWKNDFPVKGRTNYPLLFDREHQPKPAYFALKALRKA